MSMVSYVVHDSSTGEIVHVHVEPAELDSSPDDILHLAGLTRRGGLDVVRAPEGLPLNDALRVRDGQFHPAADAAGHGAAGGSTGWTERPTQRHYTHVRQPE